LYHRSIRGVDGIVIRRNKRSAGAQYGAETAFIVPLMVKRKERRGLPSASPADISRRNECHPDSTPHFVEGLSRMYFITSISPISTVNTPSVLETWNAAPRPFKQTISTWPRLRSHKARVAAKSTIDKDTGKLYQLRVMSVL
jgi:hypothetical protein